MKKLWILILILIIGAIGFVYFSPSFSRVKPTIKIYTNGYTNLQKPIKIEIKDKIGIKSYRIIAKGNGFEEVISKSANPNLGKDVVVNVKLPKINAKNIQLTVIAIDKSHWHFFKGNRAEKSVILTVDATPPNAVIIDNSYAIGRGGSALVVVEVNDKNLKNTYILVDNKYKFKLIPFVKKGYYAALIAWPFDEKTFDANVVATDYAGNKSVTHIPLYWRTGGIYKLHSHKLKISNNFIQNIAKNVLIKMGMKVPDNPIKIFQMENQTLRKIDEKNISEITGKVYENEINNFYIRRFDPLPGSVKEAGFMDLRHYYYNGQEISTAVHKGIDLAKIEHAKVYASNPGKVVAEKYEGIYGNTLFLYHGLGLYSSYSHLSEFIAQKGQEVHRGEVIARTGSTGGVFGDHLHFGMYVQGVFVNPLEWMDPHWIRLNILNIIKQAKRIINQ